MKIIGLGYKARSGKDTAAEMLRMQHGFLHYSFAAQLKKVCAEVFGFDAEQLHGTRKETIDLFWGFSPRWAMQQVGTECFKPAFGKNIWVRALERRIFDREIPYSYKVQGIVISDVRFEVECEAIKSWGGQVVRIDRGNRDAIDNSVKHSSETELDNYSKWDAVIDNNGTLDELQAQVARLVR